MLENLKITSGDDVVIISATNSESYVDISIDANVIEEGEVYVNKTNLIKAYNL